MIACFSKTNIGYLHTREGKVCQDFSASYHDEERTIIAACDGHGGKAYIRSDIGSRYAVKAVLSAFQGVERSLFYRCSKEEICDKLRLQILCEWNNLVENHLTKKRISKRETEGLSEEELFKLRRFPVKAYGTTLQGAMLFAGKLICVSLGDGGIFLLKKGEVIPAFEEDEETVANLTYSLCQEDAYQYLKAAVFDLSEFDGVLACTDGVVNPYQSLFNFKERFVKPVCLNLQEGRYEETADFLKDLGEKLGTGDDVSMAIAMKTGISLRGYRRKNDF